MKCKRHPYEIGVGVCASCLRERLLALAAACNATADLALPRLDFPRSVSPYLSRSRSLGPDDPHDLQRFYSTSECGAGPCPGPGPHRKFSVLSALFGNPRSGRIEPDFDGQKGSRPRSWFSVLIRRRRRKERHPPPTWRPEDKGMSPDRKAEAVPDDELESESADDEGECGRPGPTPARKFPSKGRQRANSMSGFVVCLSPLVRPSPNRRRYPAAEGGLIGGEGSGHRRHVSGGCAAVDPNQSPKLGVFGRFR